MAESPVASRPGRKRSEDSRRAILAAALELVAEAGYGRLTIDGIATRSGTGKQTIYRWWPSKADVLMDALASTADLRVPVPEEPTLADDLRAFLSASFALAGRPPVREGLRALMAHAQLDPAFGRRFRTDFLERRRAALTALLERADRRGDRPEGLSPGTVCDIVFGVIWYRVLATDAPLDATLVDELVTALAPGGRRA